LDKKTKTIIYSLRLLGIFQAEAAAPLVLLIHSALPALVVGECITREGEGLPGHAEEPHIGLAIFQKEIPIPTVFQNRDKLVAKRAKTDSKLE
jgi:hypothetical protein